MIIVLATAWQMCDCATPACPYEGTGFNASVHYAQHNTVRLLTIRVRLCMCRLYTELEVSQMHTVGIICQNISMGK